MKQIITLLLAFTALVAAQDDLFLKKIVDNKTLVTIAGISANTWRAFTNNGYEMIPQPGNQLTGSQFRVQLDWRVHPGEKRDMYRITYGGRCLGIKGRGTADENDNLYWSACQNNYLDTNQYFFFYPQQQDVHGISYRMKLIYQDLYIQLDLDDDNCFELEPYSNLDSLYTGTGRMYFYNY